MREDYEVTESPWRNTALPPMLWFIEFYAIFPIVLWMVHISWPTFYLAIGVIAILVAINHAGYDALACYRTLQYQMVKALTGGYVG